MLVVNQEDGILMPINNLANQKRVFSIVRQQVFTPKLVGRNFESTRKEKKKATNRIICLWLFDVVREQVQRFWPELPMVFSFF